MSDIDYSLYPLVYCLQPSPEKENHRRTTIKRTGTKNQVAQLEKERELISLRERATALREQLFRRLSASQKIPSLSGKAKENTDDNKSRLTSEEIDELIETVNNIWSGFAERLKILIRYSVQKTSPSVAC